MGWIDDTDTLFPHRSDRGNITAERLLFMVEETEAGINYSGMDKAKTSDNTNPDGSRSSEVFFNRNPGRLKLSKLSDNTNPRGMILDRCHLKKIFAD